MPRGNPYPHRYKYGKIDKPIDLPVFLKLQERVSNVDRSGYPVEFIQALLALFYWTGLRKTEVLGRKEIKYRVKEGIEVGKPHPGLLKEDIRVKDSRLFVFMHACLLEAGFDYVTDMDGVKLFRKRK